MAAGDTTVGSTPTSKPTKAFPWKREKARAYAGLYDLELVDVIIDAGESAKTLNRPGLQRALAMLKTGKTEALLVVKVASGQARSPNPVS